MRRTFFSLPAYRLLLVAALLLVIITLLSPASPAAWAAPYVQEDPWQAPVNLSASGSATDPAMVIDETGLVHVIWQDAAIDSFVYSQGGAGASAPIAIELPFGSRTYYPNLNSDEPTPLFTPLFIADGTGVIHALWIDDEQNLYYSRVAGAAFATMDSWSSRELLAEAVLQVTASTDDGQTLHVAYAQSRNVEELPSGLYYRQSADGGATWNAPALTHESRYFRTLTADEFALSAASAGSGEEANVYFAWDNRILDRVFLVQSQDGGASWSEASVIDLRSEDDSADAVGPAEMKVTLHENQVHLMWRAGHEMQICALYHQWSNDGGATWQPRQQLVTESQSCPLFSQFLKRQEGHLLALAAYQQQGYLLAWDGERWSEVQREIALREFLDPETSRRIVFQARDAVVSPQGDLLVVGHDATEHSDVWLVARSLQDTETWFPAQSAWAPPVAVSDSALSPQSTLLVRGLGDDMHALWTEAESVDGIPATIFHARFVDQEWSRPAPVLTSPEANVAQSPSAATDSDGRLFTVWQSDGGVLYISQVQSENATSPSEWSTPLRLPYHAAGARAPQIAIGSDGTLYVVFAVALNEDRGLYLLTSEDRGETWSQPVQIFDGVAAGWDMIERPQLALDANDTLHLLWAHLTLPPYVQTQSLHYANSTDRGSTWSDAELVDEGPITWSAIVASGDGFVQRLWRRDDQASAAFWFSTSLDGGQSWQPVDTIPVMHSLDGAVAAAADHSGRTHLVVWSSRELFYQWWDGDGWTVGDSLRLNNRDSILNREGLSVAAGIGNEGRLTVIAAGELGDEVDGRPQFRILATAQELTIPDSSPTGQPAAPPAASPVASPQPSPESQPESTASATATTLPQLGSGSADGNGNGAPLLDPSNPLSSLLFGVIPVLLLVLIVLAVRFRRDWLARR